jgi:hypothetical protein
MPVATITDYSVGLFIHILAVVLAFGPTFGYGILFSVLPNYPGAAPAMLAGVEKVSKYLVYPGTLIVLLAGIYLMAEGNWDGGEGFIVVGFIAIVVLLGLQHAFFRPQTAKARELAERDLERGGPPSEEFLKIAKRLGTVGPIAGLIVVVTIFFMTVKP